MISPNLRALYRHILPESIRMPLYSLRKQVQAMLYRNYVTITDNYVSDLTGRLADLHNAYRGQRCFIMGNGPSLNKMDLGLLNGEIVWGSNRCYLLFDRVIWRPRFYVAVDKRVVPDNAAEINKLSHQLPDTKFFYPVSFRYRQILQSAKNVYWYNEISRDDDVLPNGAFSTSASEFVYSVYTVTVAMLQLAVYLGFNPIYLIGCDTSYSIPRTVQFENGNPDMLISTDKDPNHFDPSYFGKHKKWHDPHVDRMIFHYEQSRQVCNELGVEVYNATIGGNLEVFPRVDFVNLF